MTRPDRRLRAPARLPARSLAALIVLTAAMWLPAGAAPLGEDVQGLLELARTQNPELALMRAEAEAAQRRVQPAGALPDPVLRVELMNVNNYGSNAGFNLLPSKVGETRYTVMQQLPWSGKLGLKREVASADARQAQARTAAAWTELAMRIKTAYASYWLAAGNERITREVLDLLAGVEQIAQARYAGGLVQQQDAIRAQLEQTTMRSELIALQAERQQQQARLNALLARDAGAPLAQPRLLRPVPAIGPLDTPALRQRAQDHNPQLQAEQARVAAAEKTRELTYRNRYPDFNVGVVPSQMGTRLTTWGVMMEMNIPLQQTTRRSQEAESEAMLAAARARVQSVGTQLDGELGAALASLQAARQTQALATDQSLPQSQLSLRSAIASYENGKLDFTALLEAQRQIRRVRQDQIKAQAEAQMRLAEVERIIGEDL